MKKENFDLNIGVWKKLFNIDDKTIRTIGSDIQNRNTVYKRLASLSVAPWFVWIISIIERLMAPKMIKDDGVSVDDFVLVSCLDPVHRVKRLPLIAKGFKYSIFFLPTVTRPTMVRKYYKHYLSNPSEKVLFGTFTASDVKEYRKFLKQNKQILKSIKCDNAGDEKLLRFQMMRYALYSIYAKRVFSNVNNKQLWLFEHDKFFFIPVIGVFRSKNVTTVQLQHGTFFDPRTAPYIPLYSDKIICCSERERALYVESGVNNKDVYVLGAPLQTLVAKKDIVKTEEKYDLLVLLTMAWGEFTDMQKKGLEFIHNNYSDKKTLVRFRPRSKEADKKALSPYLHGQDVSEGTNLMQDLMSAKKVVTFSEDSIYEVIRANKNFAAFVSKDELYGNYLDGVCFTIEDIKSCMSRLFESDEKEANETYISLFGETDVDKLRVSFCKIIESLKRKA